MPKRIEQQGRVIGSDGVPSMEQLHLYITSMISLPPYEDHNLHCAGTDVFEHDFPNDPEKRMIRDPCGLHIQ